MPGFLSFLPSWQSTLLGNYFRFWRESLVQFGVTAERCVLLQGPHVYPVDVTTSGVRKGTPRSPGSRSLSPEKHMVMM